MSSIYILNLNFDCGFVCINILINSCYAVLFTEDFALWCNCLLCACIFCVIVSVQFLMNQMVCVLFVSECH